MSRRASAEDVHEICMALPDVEFGTSWGDRPTYKVQGKGFLLYRAPHQTAVDPVTGELYDDLLVVVTSTAVEKEVFTPDHLRNFNAVLVQESRLPEMSRDELAEIITDAWSAKAPRTLVKKYFSDA
jgi:hypothetical protein